MTFDQIGFCIEAILSFKGRQFNEISDAVLSAVDKKHRRKVANKRKKGARRKDRTKGSEISPEQKDAGLLMHLNAVGMPVENFNG